MRSTSTSMARGGSFTLFNLRVNGGYDITAATAPRSASSDRRRNSFTGADGADTLNGGSGIDSLTGGAGNDHFVFDDAPNASYIDVITDFQVAPTT